LHPAALPPPRAPHPRPPQLGPRLRPRLPPHPSNRRHLLPPHQRRRRRLPRARPQRAAPAFPQAPHHPHRHRSLDAPSRSRRPRPYRHPSAPHPSRPPPRSRGRQHNTASLSHNPRCPLRSEEHTSELQSLTNLVCRLLLEKQSETPLTDLVSVPPPPLTYNFY